MLFPASEIESECVKFIISSLHTIKFIKHVVKYINYTKCSQHVMFIHSFVAEENKQH